MNRAMMHSALGAAVMVVLFAPTAFAQAPAAPPSAPATVPAKDAAPTQDAPNGESAAPGSSTAAAASPAPPPAPMAVAPTPAPAPPNPYYGYGPTTPQPGELEPNQVRDVSEEDQPGKGLGNHQSHWMIAVGGRSMLVKDARFDPFADSDSFSQFSLLAERTVLVDGKMSLNAALGWDYGARSSDARGSTTELDVHRIALGPELRYHLIPRLYVFGRIAPGALHEGASLNDPLVGSNRLSEGWVFGADATLGGAFELLGKRNGASHKPRCWVIVEGGYSWAAPSHLRFDEASNPSTAPVRMSVLDFGSLSLSGPMFRAAVAISFDP